MKIWLDDQQYAPEGWRLAFCQQIFVFWLASSVTRKEDVIEDISFDHDLGFCTDGYECMKLVLQLYTVAGLPHPRYHIHTANPEGRRRMQMLLAEYGQEESHD